jgi:hypothetical protein
MSDWLNDVIGNDLIAVYEDHFFTEDAILWLRERPRTFGELRAEEIDWLRWMAANIQDKDMLEKLSTDPDTDVRMWVACNPSISYRDTRRRSYRLRTQRSCSKQKHTYASINKT